MKEGAAKSSARYLISGIGMIIGMAVLLTIVGIYEGGRSVMDRNFWRNEVKIYDIELEDKEFASEDYLNKDDAELLVDKMPEVKGSIPVLKLDAQLKSYKASGTAMTLAVDGKYLGYANLEMLRGSFISKEDVKDAGKVAVIDDYTAVELYGTKDIIGQKLDLQVSGKKVEFTIKGVFKNFNRNIETIFDDEYPGICIIPSSVPEDASLSCTTDKIIAMVDSGLHKEEAEVRLAHLLEEEHGTAGVYSITEYNQLPGVKDFTDKYLVFGIIVAIVGLISGGIGEMNAMLLFIQERKKEIGLYKFYGSGIKELQYDIVYRMLVICHSLGMLGLALGTLTGAFIGSYINIRTRFTLLSIFITVAASVLVGILSSMYPASKIKQVDASESIWGE